LFSAGQTGKVCWKNNWVSYLDSILQIKILQEFSRDLCVPTFIHKLILDPKQHATVVQELETKDEDVGELDPSSLNETVTLLLVRLCYLNNGKLQTFYAFLLHPSLYMVSTQTA
jgi:hypothetical protein